MGRRLHGHEDLAKEGVRAAMRQDGLELEALFEDLYPRSIRERRQFEGTKIMVLETIARPKLAWEYRNHLGFADAGRHLDLRRRPTEDRFEAVL